MLKVEIIRKLNGFVICAIDIFVIYISKKLTFGYRTWVSLRAS